MHKTALIIIHPGFEEIETVTVIDVLRRAGVEVVAAARRAKAGGADRFCMGAGWRSLKDRDVPKVAAMISAVKVMTLIC